MKGEILSICVEFSPINENLTQFSAQINRRLRKLSPGLPWVFCCNDLKTFEALQRCDSIPKKPVREPKKKQGEAAKANQTPQGEHRKRGNATHRQPEGHRMPQNATYPARDSRNARQGAMEGSGKRDDRGGGKWLKTALPRERGL